MVDLGAVVVLCRSYLGTLFEDDEEGQGLVEYGLIIVLVSIVVVAALTAVGGALNNVFNNITGKLAV